MDDTTTTPGQSARIDRCAQKSDPRNENAASRGQRVRRKDLGEGGIREYSVTVPGGVDRTPRTKLGRANGFAPAMTMIPRSGSVRRALACLPRSPIFQETDH